MIEKHTKEVIIRQEGTRMVNDGEDGHGLQITNLKSLGYIFQDAQTVRDEAPKNDYSTEPVYATVSRDS